MLKALHYLTVLFIALKILGFITISWWMVFLPTIISIGLTVMICVILTILALLADL